MTENEIGCLDVIIKPQFFFFPPRRILQFQFVFISHITVKDAVNRKDSAYGVKDREEEESREIMQPRLSVMDS